MSNVQRLIFDVETVGVDFDSLDKISRESLQKYFERYSKTEEEIEESKDRLGFWPLTGEVVAIGVMDFDQQKSKILVQAAKKDVPEKLEENIGLETGTEKEILEKFWEIANHYNYFISFNGRGFDVPFLMIRSAIHGLKPSKNLMSDRYLNRQAFNAIHIDLADQLTFYGAFRKNFPLHFWAKAFGDKSPKEQGTTGDDVKRLFKEGKILEIARYNWGDLAATRALYQKWQEYLNI